MDEKDTQKENWSFNVTTIPNYSIAPRLSFILNNMAGGYKLLNTLINRADIVHAISSIGTLVSYIKNRSEKPVVSNVPSIPIKSLRAFISSPFSTWTPGDFFSDFIEYPLSHFFMKRMLDKSDYIIVNSPVHMKDVLMSYSLPVDKFFIIPSSFDFNAQYYVSSAISNARVDPCSIAYCGRLTSIKGVHFLIKAFSILTKEIKNASLKIIGWGPMGHYLMNLVSELGLNCKVNFLGAVPRTRAIQEIKSSNFLVLPSFNETGSPPNVACEAMALGKPIVAFNLPFIREFVHDNYNGLLVKPSDLMDLSEKMVTLLKDKDISMKLGENAYTYVKEKHNFTSNVKKYIKIYEKLVGE